jgi:hypothetical protein
MLQNQYIMFHLRKQNINRNEIHDLDFPIKIYIYIYIYIYKMYIFMNYITMMITWCVVTMLRVWARKGRDGGVCCGPPPYSKQGHCFCVIIIKKLDPLQSSPPHYQTVTIIHRVLWYSVRFSFRSTVQMAGGIFQGRRYMIVATGLLIGSRVR